MSDWENEDEDVGTPVISVAAKGAWDDEDASDDDVKDAWDASDEEGEKTAEQKSSSTSAAAPKKKKTLAQKIAERKEEEERKRAEFAQKQAKSTADDDEYPDETPEERKARLQQAVVEADLQNAKDLFGAVPAGQPAASNSKLETMNPTTKLDFDEYLKEVNEKFSTFESKAQYSYFVESLVRSLLVPLNLEDTRRISSSVTAMINEKQKAQKTVGGKKKARKKAALKSGPGAEGGIDTTNYDDVYDDYEDFM
ncbi:eukaryotic translation initiation factor 3 subunit J [Fimicolochytrium jonesii]|uniref:eukaryotic translation initiation factor 3 subunit J n=1 Tax=Fimicolochytrium jonesii TaxID=1396493 RepID=UPI0022FE6608|nr:eukaryotic translation initiation factor 3 subunit J [Fimicolochytrium jonesii]KAI8819865.1 eukaryotic translation initiation factor 3 subunit J [Fimicolochytrium jonesii]